MDLLLLNVPPCILSGPPIGPAAVIAAVRAAGFSGECFDLNLDLYQKISRQIDIQDWFYTDFMFDNEANFRDFRDKYLEPVMVSWIDLIRKKNPRWLGLSVITYRCKNITIEICRRIRAELPDLKIVIGGGGVLGEARRFGQVQQKNWVSELYSLGLIDAYVRGEGEKAIINVLLGDLNEPGINGCSPTEVEDLSALPFPDYSDFPVPQYFEVTRQNPHWTHKWNWMFIESSRGCVRKCKFCNIPSSTQKFRFRSGIRIAEEMISHRKQYGVHRFNFADNLVNGSIKHLVHFCEVLSEYRKNPDFEDIRWSGAFVIRSERHFPKRHFQLMRSAGCNTLMIGVESGSEAVRKHMRKLFNNEDLDYTVQQSLENGIHCILLFMVGYPTETERDFEDTLRILHRYKAHSKNISLRVSWRVGIVGSGTELEDEMLAAGYHIDEYNEWSTQEVDIHTSAQRYLQFKRVAAELGYSMPEKQSMTTLKSSLEHYPKPSFLARIRERIYRFQQRLRVAHSA